MILTKVYSMLKKSKLFKLLIFISMVLSFSYFLFSSELIKDHRKKDEKLEIAKNLVKIQIYPKLEYQFDIMKEGVLQHIDRDYKYDIVPDRISDGILFRTNHEVPKGTTVQFELLSPAEVYLILCHDQDGGYLELIEQLSIWKKQDQFPQYDIYNGMHGMRMDMYLLYAEPGVYKLPVTIKEDACFNIVFKNQT